MYILMIQKYENNENVTQNEENRRFSKKSKVFKAEET